MDGMYNFLNGSYGISHILFADDMLLFVNLVLLLVCPLKRLLADYEVVSNQMVNESHMSDARRMTIVPVTIFTHM